MTRGSYVLIKILLCSKGMYNILNYDLQNRKQNVVPICQS